MGKADLFFLLRILHLADVSAPRMGTSSREDEVEPPDLHILAQPDFLVALGIRIARLPSRTCSRKRDIIHLYTLFAAQRRHSSRLWNCGNRRARRRIRVVKERVGQNQGTQKGPD